MPVPKKKCEKCFKKMTYDPILSKKRSKTKLNSFWCTNCNYIMTEETFEVKDAVRSIRRYLFTGKLP